MCDFMPKYIRKHVMNLCLPTMLISLPWYDMMEHA